MSDLRKTEIKIHAIGSQAKVFLLTEEHATLFGDTSRGVFLKSDNQKMIFLSYENFRGPLTINLFGGKKICSNLSVGGNAVISQDEITFPDFGFSISTANAKPWKPPLPAEAPLRQNDRIERIRFLARDIYLQSKISGLREMLPGLAGFDPEYSSSDRQLQGFFDGISSIKEYLIQDDWASLVQPILSFLGLGSGLTPSGDDFVIGFLLSLNRWEALFQSKTQISKLNRIVVEAACHSTTTLSANLIESATLGLADERLIKTVDFLAAGKYSRNGILPGILSWGSSSGVDAFAGMLTAFQTVNSS